MNLFRGRVLPGFDELIWRNGFQSEGFVFAPLLSFLLGVREVGVAVPFVCGKTLFRSAIVMTRQLRLSN